MKKIKAFTLAELSFVFIFIGVISVIALHTVNERRTDFYARYFTAYDALSKAVYNTYVDTYCRVVTDSSGKTDCEIAGSEFSQKGRPFPDNPRDLCKRLAEYLNVSGDPNCSNDVIKDASDEEFKNIKPQLTLSNSFRIYFSSPGDVTVNHAGKKNRIVNYFIVYVDLNGKEKLNTAAAPNPDIVPFIVTYTGDTIPIGYPIYDKSYISARLVDFKGNPTKSYTLDEARMLAFGNVAYTDIPQTLIPIFKNELPQGASGVNTASRIFNIGDDGTAPMGCTPGTFTCMLKIDDFEGRRN